MASPVSFASSFHETLLNDAPWNGHQQDNTMPVFPFPQLEYTAAVTGAKCSTSADASSWFDSSSSLRCCEKSSLAGTDIAKI
ncbi:hypothetical protein Tco_0246770 [Tanacetum coccineum]